jgi:AP-3 complex subunit sigma
MCNFIEGSTTSWGKDTKLIYRHYATLYFVFVVDESESELGILDLIQTFVEALDRIFRNVCELDMILHVDRVVFFSVSNSLNWNSKSLHDQRVREDC